MTMNSRYPHRTAALVAALATAFGVAHEPAYAQVPTLDTVTAINSPVCATYKGGSVDLVAKLTELVGGLPVGGGQIDFTVGTMAAGSASTDTDGFATYPVDITSATAGDYPLKAEFPGDATYNGSSDIGVLGVSYNFGGFLPPLRPAGSPIVIKGGRVLPVKIRLLDADLSPVTTAAPKVWVHNWTPGNGLGERLAPPTSAGAANGGNTMRYSPMDQQYIFNWDTRDLPGGSYAVVVEPGDSVACSQGPYYATLTVAKRKK